MDNFSSQGRVSQATYESLPASNDTLHGTSDSYGSLYLESTGDYPATNQHLRISPQYDLNHDSMYQGQSTYNPLGYAA